MQEEININNFWNTLHPNFHISDAVLYFNRDFNDSIQIFESYIDNISKIDTKQRKRLLYIFTEISQNINKHSSSISDSILLVFHNKTNSDSIITIISHNPISNIDVEKITCEINIFENNTTSQIKQEIRNRILSGKTGTGLLNISIKSSKKPNLKIIELKNQKYLNLKTEINVKNHEPKQQK
jgi:hypothetical protein